MNGEGDGPSGPQGDVDDSRERSLKEPFTPGPAQLIVLCVAAGVIVAIVLSLLIHQLQAAPGFP